MLYGPCRAKPGAFRRFAPRLKRKARAGRPGFFWNVKPAYQAAGLNSFDALALIGSAVSAATFWLSSASCLVWAVKVSNCVLACEAQSSIASVGDFTLNSCCAKSRFAVEIGRASCRERV